MTGQVDFDSHSSVVTQAALALMNEVSPGYRRGREFPASDDLSEAMTRAIASVNPTWGGPPNDAAAARLAAWAVRLHRAVTAVDAGDVDAACVEVNQIMREAGALPTLARHDDEPWHLHFHAVDAPWDESWAASMATSLAIVLGNATIDRLGICNATACDRAYLDVSRNGTRRFCSTACQNRVKAAAFRARQSG